MFTLSKHNYERYESSSSEVKAVSDNVEALREYAKQFGCYPEMWDDNNVCVTFEELCLEGDSVYAQECYYIEPVTLV